MPGSPLLVPSPSSSSPREPRKDEMLQGYFPNFQGEVRVIPEVPINLLQDLASVHHLISQDAAEYQRHAEEAAIETFCSMVWGVRSWNRYIWIARNFGRPPLAVEDEIEARKLEHETDSFYRNKGIALFDATVEHMKRVDVELGIILDSCKGDWMTRFQRHFAVQK